jgi:hypothetical protein
MCYSTKGNIVSMEETRNAYKISVGKSERKKPFQTSRHR